MLTILEERSISRSNGRKDLFYLVRCDCGVEKLTHKSGVIAGRTVSCGCYAKEKMINSKRLVTHNHASKRVNSRTYRIWCHMKQRCFNPKTESYPLYGGRGITISSRWMDFENFLEDMGECPPKHSIDRIDVNGDYERANCRWATNRQQASNRRSTLLLEFNGQRMNHQEWAEKLGFKYGTIIKKRLKWGWSVAETVSTRKGQKRVSK